VIERLYQETETPARSKGGCQSLISAHDVAFSGSQILESSSTRNLYGNSGLVAVERNGRVVEVHVLGSRDDGKVVADPLDCSG
jgi:hypothetical protein